ncbi:MAG: AsmA-like C-terminal region-containing protein, partial [Kiloniellales bacterium]
FEQVTLRGGRLVFRGDGDPLTLEVERLDLAAADSSSPVSLALVGRYNGSPFEANGTLGSIGRLSVGSGPFPLALVVRSGASELSLQGEIAQPRAGSGLRFEVSGEGRSLADLSPFAGAELPALGPWSFDTKLAQDGTSYRLSALALRLSESDLAGTASVDLGKERPLVTAALTADRIRLADFTEPEPDGAADDGRIFSDEPLPLDALKLFDAEVKLAAASFEPHEKVKLETLDLLLALKGGKLKVAPFTATLAGGKLAGGFDLDAGVDPPSVALALTGKQVDYGRLLRELEIYDTVEGKLDLELVVSGSGNSLHDIASTLKGKSDLVGGEGRLDNTLVTLVSADLLGLLGPLFGSEEAMEISCLVSRFDIADGIAESSAQLLHAESFTLQGGGQIDLASERIDMLFEPKSSLPSLTSLAIPFRIQGPLTDPGVIPDPLGTALTAAKTAGAIIMPLAGLGILLGDAVLGAGNPCTAALEAGASGQSQEKSVIDKATEGVGETLDSIGEGIKGLFGN